MADKETEQEWAKLRQIEAEREKARRSLREQKPDVASLSYLDYRPQKVKGWSTDRNLLLAKTEKLGTWSVVLAPIGAVMMMIADAGSIVSEVGRFGLGGAIISDLPGMLGLGCLGLAALFAVLAIVVEFYYRLKDKRKFGTGWWSAIVGLVIVMLYLVVKSLLFR